MMAEMKKLPKQQQQQPKQQQQPPKQLVAKLMKSV
jgi:hypothetical protein